MKLSWGRKIEVPKTNETRITEVPHIWFVRWVSRHGTYSSDTRIETEAFTDEAEAEAFATSLRQAFKLLRHTSNTSVTVAKKS